MRLFAMIVLGLFLSLASASSVRAQAVISPDGKLVARSVGNAFVISDVATQKELIRIVGHAQAVTALAFTPDGRQLVSGSSDKTVKFWDAASGRALRKFSIDTAVFSVSADEKILTIVDVNKKTRAFEIASGQEVKLEKK